MAVATAPGPGTVRRSWRYWTRQLVWAAVDLVYPPQCAGCGRAGQRFCSDCQSRLATLKPPLCENCGYPVGQPGKCNLCLSGANPPALLAGISSAAFHAGPLRKAIHQLKYKRDGILADTLARCMVATEPHQAPKGSLVVPVPLSPQRLKTRGYNQAALLARAYSELRGLRLATQAALRVRDTNTQVGLSARQRRLNVAGAFAAERRVVAGKFIILIDDVCTTGATLEACGAALLAAGASRVWGLTLARAPLFEQQEEAIESPAGAGFGQAGADF